MELRVLNYFLMVAREENITRAANQLHVTQPTLSRQMMQLEEELGTKLFDRSSHSIVLTEEGMLLRRRAQELVALAEKTEREIKRQDEVISGEIAVGSGELRSIHTFSEIAASFNKKHPDVRYSIYSGNADNIKERMDKGLIDVALLLEPVDVGKYEFVRLMEREQWGVLVREDSPLAEKATLTPEDLLELPLMLPGRELVQSELFSWFGNYAEQLNIKLTYNLIYNAAAMVEQGMGVALTLQLNGVYKNLKFIPLSPVLTESSVLVWKKNQVMPPVLSAFLKYAKNYLKGEVEQENGTEN